MPVPSRKNKETEDVYCGKDTLRQDAVQSLRGQRIEASGGIAGAVA